MHTIIAPADIRESKIPNEPLSDAVAFQRSQRIVLRRNLGSIEECKSAQLQGVVFLALNFEFCVQLFWKDHRNVLMPIIGREIIRPESERALLCACSYRVCGEGKDEWYGKFDIEVGFVPGRAEIKPEDTSGILIVVIPTCRRKPIPGVRARAQTAGSGSAWSRHGRSGLPIRVQRNDQQQHWRESHN